MTSSIARMNCFLHGIEDFRIERGDTLAEPKFVQGDRLMRFDMVLANPPCSIKQWDRNAFFSDPLRHPTPGKGRLCLLAAYFAEPRAQDGAARSSFLTASFLVRKKRKCDANSSKPTSLSASLALDRTSSRTRPWKPMSLSAARPS